MRLESVDVEVIFPAADGTFPALSKITGLGRPKFVWLSALNASMRNCVFTRSVTWKFLKSDILRVVTPARFSVLRPTFPRVPFAGKAKHSVLMYLLGSPVFV